MSVNPASGLPPVNQALEPSWVRHGSQATQRDYATALAFERTLVEQLAKSMSAIGQPGEEGGSQEGESGSSMGAGLSQISSMLPPALSSSVMSSGGLGLAGELTRAMQGPAGHGTAGISAESGGTAPGGSAS